MKNNIRNSHYDNPSDYAVCVKLFALTLTSVFISEVVIMFILATLPEMSITSEAIFDGFLLSVLIFPMLYWLSYRPMLKYIRERQKAEAELQRMNGELEERVAERTADLENANTQLRKEIAEREHAEKEVLKNNDFILRIVESAPDLTFIYDLNNHRCVFVNNRITELGYTPEEIYLMSNAFPSDVLAFDAFSSSYHLAEQMENAEDGHIFQSNGHLKDSDGNPHPYRLRMVLFAKNERNMPLSVLCTATYLKEKNAV